MKKFNINDFRMLVKDSGLSYAQISKGAGVTKPWFRAVMENKMMTPNPEWIEATEMFLKSYAKIQSKS